MERNTAAVVRGGSGSSQLTLSGGIRSNIITSSMRYNIIIYNDDYK